MPLMYSIDPGMATGIALGEYGERTAYERQEVWIVKGGLRGFIDWFNDTIGAPHSDWVWVVEKFILRDNDFIANTEALRIEGAIEAFGIEPIYQLRTDKALCKDQVLKDNGLWVTGKMVDHTDGRDANDATIHALARMKKIRHGPTLMRYW